MAARARDVFVNCPFDEAYKPIFYAIVFAVIRSGFRARCALEADDSAEVRLAKILSIIAECRYGVHDISRTELDGDPPLPRFNMPLELGLFLGAKRYGDGSQAKKRCIIFDREPHRYQRFLSDIAGQDIHSHGGEEATAIRLLAGWLRRQTRVSNVPGGNAIANEYAEFRAALPNILQVRNLSMDEVTFSDYTEIIVQYLLVQG